MRLCECYHNAWAQYMSLMAVQYRAMPCHGLQECRRGEQHLHEMHAAMRALLEDIKARGPPADEDKSIAAHLLRIRDPQTGGEVQWTSIVLGQSCYPLVPPSPPLFTAPCFTFPPHPI